MRMNKAKALCVLGCVCLQLFAGAFLAKAQETEKETAAVTVIDDASVLMEEEIDWVKEVASDLAKDSGWTVVAASCGDAGGRNSREVCEGYFVSYADGSDGISCLIDTDNQKMELVAAGEAKKYFTNRKIRNILREADEGFEKEDYAQCFFLMLLGAREAYVQGGQSFAAKAFPAVFAALVIVGGVVWIENITKLKKNKENDTEE